MIQVISTIVSIEADTVDLRYNIVYFAVRIPVYHSYLIASVLQINFVVGKLIIDVVKFISNCRV